MKYNTFYHGRKGIISFKFMNYLCNIPVPCVYESFTAENVKDRRIKRVYSSKLVAPR